MTVRRGVWGCIAVLIAGATASAPGCVNNSAAPPSFDAGALPLFDANTPFPEDSGSDASSSARDASADAIAFDAGVDATIADAGAGEADANDAAVAADAGPPASAVATGDEFACALLRSGAVKCWGDDGFGELGAGFPDAGVMLTPVDVQGLGAGTTVAITTGYGFACALTTAGGVKCWGYDEDGELGATATNQTCLGNHKCGTTPIDVVGATAGVAGVSSGAMCSCLSLVDGGAQCWGSNIDGTLGDSTANDSPTPVNVTGLGSGVAQVSNGDGQACALTTAGAVECWGYNANGQVGDGTYDSTGGSNGVITPAAVVGLSSGVASLVAGDNISCVLTTAGGVECWGLDVSREVEGVDAGADAGTTCVGGNLCDTSPAAVPGLSSGVASIAVGTDFVCALTTAGGVKCWGFNDDGELGNGSTTSSRTPVDVTGLGSGVASISAGQHFACAVMTAGGVKCWGYDGDGELGSPATETCGTDPCSMTPVDVFF